MAEIGEVLAKLRSMLGQNSIRSVLKTFSIQTLGNVLLVFVQLLQAPLVLRYWTAETFTLWLGLFTIPCILWTLETGLGHIVSDEMIRAKARSNAEAFVLLEESSSSVYSILIAFSILCAGVFLVLSNSFLNDFWGSWRQCSAQIVVSMLIYLIAGVSYCYSRAPLRALQKLHWVSIGGIILRTIELSCPILSIACGKDIAFACSLLAVFTVMLALVFWVLYKNTRSSYHYRPARYNQFGHFSGMVRRAASLQFYEVANVLQQQGSFLIVRSLLGPGVALLLSTGRAMIQAGLQPAMGFFFAASPYFCEREAVAEHSKHFSGISMVLCGGILYSFVAFIGIQFFGVPAIAWWTHGKVVASRLDCLFIGFVLICMVMMLPFRILLNSRGQYKVWSLWSGCSMIGTFLLVFVVCRFGSERYLWPVILLGFLTMVTGTGFITRRYLRSAS